MPVPVKSLSVRANPWIVGCIDHLGRPAGRVHVDPYEHSPQPATFVGCQFTDVTEVAPAQFQRIGRTEVPLTPARHDHRIVYAKGAVSIPPSGYYRDAVARGDLIAADEKTSRYCGLTKFVKPDDALAAAKAAAVEHFNATTGENAYAEMGAFEPLWIGDESSPAPVAAPNKPPIADSKGA